MDQIELDHGERGKGEERGERGVVSRRPKKRQVRTTSGLHREELLEEGQPSPPPA